MKRRLVFATTNQGKLGELMGLVGDSFEVVGAHETAQVPEVVEDAETFEGNAQKKALAFARATGLLSLGDDSGLCVDALNGAPGVYSARYAPTGPERISRLLRELQGVTDDRRSARFVCSLCLATPEGVVGRAEGRCEGRIIEVPRGAHGFGYDPVFELPDGRTMAELTRDEKATVSHRGAAFARLLSLLRTLGY